ncbi:hypothetical protein NQ317_000817 [Molorchus minor]|uniref:26S proteasome non-ATPase regulatory subunit 6 n=1 Tax=Molorchus minor TaxID=1323400 RepID=A0ABQ9ITQ5_9CUCU|nr:hypothetical protein NQ317_000817 [Molorchus minor]
MEDDKLESDDPIKNPDLDIAQLKFKLSLPEYSKDDEKKSQLLEVITVNDMAPYYEMVCEDFDWEIKEDALKEMKERNTEALQAFDEEIEYSLNNLSVIDVKEAYLNKANYLSKIGDRENTIKTLSQAYDKTVALGCQLDNVFHCIRIGLFFMDLDLIRRNLQRASDLVDQGADWHSRNCYQMCKALFSLIIKDFSVSTDIFVNAISTFICTELISYDNFIKYTVLSASLTLNRREVKKNLIDNPDILQALHLNSILNEYIISLYECDYMRFFERLADIEIIMKEDMFLHFHYRYYIREMKTKAYDQLLSTYISVKLSYMADQFGVSSEYIENDISNLIANGRLNYKIDKVTGTINNTPKDLRTELFKSVIKHGDPLLNRVQDLSRVINI